MQDAAAGVRLRLRTRAQFEAGGGLPGRAVRVGKRQPDVVFGAGLQIQDRSRETGWYEVLQVFPVAANLFAADAEEREGLPPRAFCRRLVLYVYFRVAIGVSLDRPGEAQVSRVGGSTWRRPA